MQLIMMKLGQEFPNPEEANLEDVIGFVMYQLEQFGVNEETYNKIKMELSRAENI